MHPSSPEHTTHGSSAERARLALEQRRLNLVHGNLDSSIGEAYEQSDTVGGLGLERAQGIISQQGSATRETFGAAQRAIESTIGQGVWTDTVREAAVQLNRETSDQPALGFEQVLTELKGYQSTWKEAARTDKDEHLDNEANALGYNLSGAKRGDAQSIEGVLKAVEKMLGSGMGNSDETRGAGELRAMRDALFIEKRRVQVAQEEAAREQQESQARDAATSVIRSKIDALYSGDNSEQPATAPVVAIDTAANSDVERYTTMRQEFEELSPEEKEFRNRLAQAKTMYGVSTTGELGLSRDAFAAITPEQQTALTELLTRSVRDRTRYVGEVEVNKAREQLRRDIETALTVQPDTQEDSTHVEVTTPEAEVEEVAEARQAVERAIASQSVESKETSTIPEASIVKPVPQIQEAPVEAPNQEVIDQQRKAAEMQRVRQAHNFIGRYLSGSSAGVARDILQKMAGEADQESAEL